MISVIIPAYNVQDTIVEALESVKMQSIFRRDEGGNLKPELGMKMGEGRDEGGNSPRRTSLPELEVIVVDDASVDETVKVVDSWIRRLVDSEEINELTNYRIIELSENKGPSTARNRGIAEAKGEWIAFLDSDDVWLSGKLKIQMEFLKQHPDVDMVCGDIVAKQQPLPNDLKNSQHYVQPVDLSPLKADPPLMETCQPVSAEEIALKDFIFGNPVATSTVIACKSALDAVGGFDEQFCGPEDYDLWMRIAVNHKIVKMNRAVSVYRVESGSLCMDDRKFLPQVLKVLEKAYDKNQQISTSSARPARDKKGALSCFPEMKRVSISTQYWHASWMAFNRGARGTAVKHWCSAYVRDLMSYNRQPREWFKLLARYIFGRH